MTVTPWILISILGLIFILAIIAFSLYKYGKKDYKPDYQNLFVMGVIFLIFGIIWDLIVFWILGVIYMIIGIVHKDKWKKNRRTWKKLNKTERKIFIGIIIALLLFFVVGIGTYLLMNGSMEITNFEECATAGNPVMESYPRQCRTNGENFVEIIDGNSPLTGSIVNENPQL